MSAISIKANGEKEPQSRRRGAAMTLVAAMTGMLAMLKTDGPKKAAALRVISMYMSAREKSGTNLATENPLVMKMR